MPFRPCRLVGMLFLAAAASALVCAVAAWAGPFHRRSPPSDCPCIPAPETTAEAEAAVRQVLDAQVAAWNHGDLDGFMAGYWSSPDLTFFSGPDRTGGWQATLDRYRKRYKSDGKEMGRLAFGDVKVEVLGSDYALVRGSWRLELAKEKPGGLFTLVFRRLPEGWRIIHDHTSK
jgi:ketosteroid isomerase-like protein